MMYVLDVLETYVHLIYSINLFSLNVCCVSPIPLGMPAKPIRSYGSRGSLGPQYPYTQDQLYSIPGTLLFGPI